MLQNLTILKIVFPPLTGLLLIVSCGNDRPATRPGIPTIASFQFRIRNTGMIKSEIFETSITEKHIRVVKGEGDDSLQFITPLVYSDTLNRISEINLAGLDSIYRNECIADGLQLTALLTKEDTTKIVHISNFYQPDLALVFEFINSYVPGKFRVTYDKKQLEEEYARCKESQKKN